MKHSGRLDEILEIISTNAVETQSELMNLLRERGYKVTQATVSRDIKRLNLHKAHDAENRYRYVSDSKNSGSGENDIIKSCVVSVDCALNDVVINCRSGGVGIYQRIGPSGVVIDEIQILGIRALCPCLADSLINLKML